jgi:hypothetical protein
MVRSTANQVVQWGIETTPGTAVPANKRLDGAMVSLGIEADVAFYRGTGRKYNTVQELNREWSSGTLDESPMDYTWMVYPLASAYGTPTIANSGASTVAKDWTFNATLSGNASTKTFSLEKGDSTTAEKLAYVVFQQWGYKGTRQSFTHSGSFIGQKVTTGTTLTASPTVVPITPINAAQFDVYLDTTNATLGTTKIVRPLSVEFTFDGIYNPAWYINTSNPSWAEHVDGVPTTTFKFMTVADTQGLALLSNMRAGDTRFIRVAAQGSLIDNLQTVSLGSATAGTFSLTYKGQTASGIAFNAAASAVQTALQGLSTIGAGNALVTGSNGGPYTVQFAGTLAQDTTALTGSGTGLTGGTFLITQAQEYNAFQHDMAVKVGKPDKWSDSDGLYAISWEFTIVEDATWGKAHQITLTNTLTSL